LTVGNDVVDLFDPEARPESLHPRFDRRVFTEAEREIIARATESNRMRWLLWAAKESAYKVVRRLAHPTPFSPVRLRVELNGADRGAIRHGEMCLPFRSRIARDYLHVVATLSSSPVESADDARDAARTAAADPLLMSDIRKVGDAPAAPETQEREARRLATEMVASLYGLPRERFEVIRRERVPRVRCDGDSLPVDLSLSHHGRFVAAAIRYLPVEASS
jgi:hypothetical protein